MGSASGWRAVEDASCRRADYCFVGLVRFPYRWLQRVKSRLPEETKLRPLAPQKLPDLLQRSARAGSAIEFTS
jgi:hypothetical protein